MEKYNVYVIRIEDFKAVALRAKNVNGRSLEFLEESFTSNPDYFIAGYEVGSPRDLELSKDLK